MARTVNLIIVDDMALVEPLAKRLGFEGAEDLLAEAKDRREGIVEFIRTARQYMESYNDRLYYLVVNTDDLIVARNVGGWYHLSVAFKSVGLPQKLDTEFDRIMLATGFQRFVAKDRLSNFEGWHNHANESERFPLPAGGHVMINREDPETAHYFQPGRLRMKKEYAFPSFPVDPNQPRWNWLLVDDVARLDEWAERLNILNFKPLSDVLNEGLTGTEAAMAAALTRSENAAKIHTTLTEHTTFYTVVPEEILKASLISLDYSEAMRREAGLPSNIFFLPKNAALITKDYFLAVRDKRGDGWSLHNKSVAPDAKNYIIEEAYKFVVRTLGTTDLPQTYSACTMAIPSSLRSGPATTINENSLREQLEAASQPDNREFFNQWVMPDNSFLGADVIKRLRERPSLGEKGSFSPELFTEVQLKRMRDLIPDVFLADGTIDISVLSKYYESKADLIGPGPRRRRLFPRLDLGTNSESTVDSSIMSGRELIWGRPYRYDEGQSVLQENIAEIVAAAWGDKPVIPSEILRTVNEYIDGMKDKSIPPFDDITCTTTDGFTLNVSVTTRDPFIAQQMRKLAGMPEQTLEFTVEAVRKDPDLGRGMTLEAIQELLLKQNKHAIEERLVNWDEVARTDKPTLYPPKDPE